MTRYDTIVIGGGLVGSAIAYGPARAVPRTALLDEGDVAYRASRGNFGVGLGTEQGRRRAAFPALDAPLGG
jgi:glycine/D-amino acid oxidase-like deaminating enzyme